MLSCVCHLSSVKIRQSFVIFAEYIWHISANFLSAASEFLDRSLNLVLRFRKQTEVSKRNKKLGKLQYYTELISILVLENQIPIQQSEQSKKMAFQKAMLNEEAMRNVSFENMILFKTWKCLNSVISSESFWKFTTKPQKNAFDNVLWISTTEMSVQLKTNVSTNVPQNWLTLITEFLPLLWKNSLE